jgi:glucan phosphoethanolaminetransferase (alkaline phosphatase superfamily)
MKKKVWTGIIFLVVLVVLIAVISIFYQKVIFRSNFDIICSKFPSTQNQTTCQEALKAALSSYPGKVYYVNKTKVLMLVDGVRTEKDVWIIGIDLREPIKDPAGNFSYRIEVAVDLYTGEKHLYRMW